MKKILAFGASNSRQSINKMLASFTANQLTNVEVKILDLNDYEMPIFSIDRENDFGIHDLAKQFKQEIIDADGIVISFAEHNSSYSAAFKNIYDWVSRINSNVWETKPLYLLATSPGGWGGRSVLESAYNRFSRGYENTIVTFSLPEFQSNFSAENGICKGALQKEFSEKLSLFEQAL